MKLKIIKIQEIVMKPTVPEVLPLMYAYYRKDGNNSGGSLHIVLDDGNVSDKSVQFCLDRAIECGDADGTALAKKLLLMSKTQRKKMYALSGTGG